MKFMLPLWRTHSTHRPVWRRFGKAVYKPIAVLLLFFLNNHCRHKKMVLMFLDILLRNKVQVLIIRSVKF